MVLFAMILNGLRQSPPWPLPQTITELHSFLGVTNTLLHFTPMYAHHATLLTDLLKSSPDKQDTLQWWEQVIKAFQDLKDIMKSPQACHGLSPLFSYFPDLIFHSCDTGGIHA